MIFASIILASLPVFDFATNSIARRIANFDPKVCLSRFLDYPPSKGKLGFPRCLFQKPFPRNERFWLKDVDFSCASPWNDSCGTTRAGTLISKRHVLFAKHYPLWKGVRIRFVDHQGEVCPCTIKTTKSLDTCDMMIGLLDYEVTESINPAKILPENYNRYIGDGNGLPIITLNQNEQVYLSQMLSVDANMIWNATATNADWKAFGGEIRKGDSGNPAFLLIGNEPILLYCLRNAGPGLGPSVFHHRHEIQKVMDELCPGYKLQSFDFSTVMR